MRQFMSQLSMRPLAAVVLAAAWLVSVPGANAQAPLPPPGPSDQTASIPDQKLDAAAAAIKQVGSIKESFEQQIEAAAPSDRERIADEANNALVKAVTDQGLSVEEYNSIMKVAQDDPDVREKIRQRLPPTTK